ncbi:Lipid A biosynthesis lauroyl acyltransferase [hydrothermal vent metagenome]|uniref:Lipid A biosynthesis lauroyl acyltransferase n=1 Tax=hydrothermal vent metagenome TaxID=652676 RepID=A0A3B1DJJ5_9ZZZZ
MGAKLPAALDTPAYWLLRGALSVPLLAGPRPSLEAARSLGRAFARMPFNHKRLERAAEHLRFACPELTCAQRLEYAERSYEHLFMLGVEISFAPRLMSEDAWIRHIELDNMAEGLHTILGDRPALLITGHCGNWELLGYTMALLGFPTHAIYRPLDNKPMDDWVRQTRARRGLVLLDKFGALRQIPDLLDAGAPIGFVADQNAGDRGLFVPFFGRLASTYKAIGMAAYQHRASVVVGQARRLGWNDRQDQPVREGFAAPCSGNGIRFRIEVEDVIHPEDWLDQPDPFFYLAARYRRGIERMVRRAPEQYLWMHRMWKSRPKHERLNRPFPDRLRKKLEALPWMTQPELDALIEQSDRDRAYMAEHNLTRLP